MFSEFDTDIQTRIPDRPARSIPNAISKMPEIPWLASRYVPQGEEKESTKMMINKIVRTAIPIVGTLAVLAVIAFSAKALLAFY